MMMRTNEQNDTIRGRFERPLEVRVMTIDGTWCGEALLLEISDRDAQIELTGHAAELAEFFLLLTSFGIPVLREWVRGACVGVSFKKTDIGIRSPPEGATPPQLAATE
jgi:hypothetical protein